MARLEENKKKKKKETTIVVPLMGEEAQPTDSAWCYSLPTSPSSFSIQPARYRQRGNVWWSQQFLLPRRS